MQDETATMSQRARALADRNDGLDAAVAAAKARGLHLAELTDDKGTLLVAASRDSFRSCGRPWLGAAEKPLTVSIAESITNGTLTLS